VKTGARVNVAAPEKSVVEENVCAPVKVLAVVGEAPPIFDKEVATLATSARLFGLPQSAAELNNPLALADAVGIAATAAVATPVAS
jgi:hypothetical protein